ncbi:tRNA pseudouridine synthase A [Actinocatenispora thailandica]|uniref:tRNA pseudouridine synthase A n=1 Tax=Actinocatenispora thailandica TaxID=227318 RepID=A0A7R7HZ30_9ACTN|nr:tRNA pseudouridine synthase A [Actinocatenispora thailandica]
MVAVRLRLRVAYDGTGFSGWAVQPARRTVAGELTAALGRLFGPVTGLTVAGRTDAGVHATGQVCHLDVPDEQWQRVATARGTGEPDPTVLVRRLAGVLPPDVRVPGVEVVDDRFDARFSALRRHYRYRITDDPAGPPPLRRFDTLGWPRPLAHDAMAAAAPGLLGEHDFAAYCRRKPDATTIRELQRLDVSRAGDGVIGVAVSADAFCQAMVRSLVGALLAVGEGRRPVDWPASLLTRSDRASEVTVAPAHGLTLVGVDYPADPAQWSSRDAATRRRRDG